MSYACGILKAKFSSSITSGDKNRAWQEIANIVNAGNSVKRDINWVNIKVIITTYIIEILDLKKNYWFGVSMETGKMSSGFTWKIAKFD
jgi:hypothetical protein